MAKAAKLYWLAGGLAALGAFAFGATETIPSEPCLFNSPEPCGEAALVLRWPLPVDLPAGAAGTLRVVASSLFALSLIILLMALAATGGVRTGGPPGAARPSRQRARSSWQNRPFPLPSRESTPDLADPKTQMEAISHVEFETWPLLNREEVPVLRLLEEVAGEFKAGFRVMAQTSLGEVLRPRSGRGTEQQRERAFRSINSKRLDFAIFNRFGKLVLAVEYQGSGHYHRTSFMRDAVKQEVLRKAGVAFLPVHERFDRGEVAQQVRRRLTEHCAHLERGSGRGVVPVQRASSPPRPPES